jgi:hypothetical protein
MSDDREDLSRLAASEESDDSAQELRRLYHDLELGDESELYARVDLRSAVQSLLSLAPAKFTAIAEDLSLFLGLSGDWTLAFEVIDKLLGLYTEEHHREKLWKLRCLVELERNAEAIALAHNTKWETASLLHVNYLTGLAYEALGLAEQAQLRFKAVFEIDPRYRDVRQKFIP